MHFGHQLFALLFENGRVFRVHEHLRSAQAVLMMRVVVVVVACGLVGL